jgi:glycosyltransferase involved in cell wall biosynthesis
VNDAEPHPLVSIVLPAFRAARFLPTAVARLEQQDLDGAFEILLVDDGSGDDTADVVRRLDAEHERVHGIVLDENVGVAHARRRGVEAARGEYVWFVDADDDWTDDALRILVALAKNLHADVVVAAAEFHYTGGSSRTLHPPVSPPVSGREAFRMLLRGEITGHLWNKLFRRDVIARASFAPARVQSDMIMVADALAEARRVGFTSQTVYQYRIRSGSIITSVSKRGESLAIIDSAIGRSAIRLGLIASNDYQYFRARYIHLSGIKDALRAAYDPAERAQHLAERRRALTWADVMVFVRFRDLRRFALALSARTSVRAHRALLAVADR